MIFFDLQINLCQIQIKQKDNSSLYAKRDNFWHLKILCSFFHFILEEKFLQYYRVVDKTLLHWEKIIY